MNLSQVLRRFGTPAHPYAELLPETQFHSPQSNVKCAPCHHSNDVGLHRAYAALTPRTFCMLPRGVKPIALVVGTGLFESLTWYWTHRLKLKGVLHVDISRDVVDSINLRIKAILECTGEEDYKERIKSAPSRYALLNPERDREIKVRLGSEHIFATRQNLKRMQESLRGAFSAVNIDLFNVGEVAALAKVLRENNYIISAMNLTNLRDYANDDQSLVKNLQLLPLTDKPQIVFSTMCARPNKIYHGVEKPLISTVANSFTDLEQWEFQSRLVENYLIFDEKAARQFLLGQLNWKTYLDEYQHSLLYRMLVRLDLRSLGYAIQNGATFLESDFRFSPSNDPQARLQEVINLVEKHIADALLEGEYAEADRRKGIVSLLKEQGLALIPHQHTLAETRGMKLSA